MGSVAIFLLAMNAQAAPHCRVLDPELQGAYAGPCKNGLAEGYGYAMGTAEYRGDFKAGMKDGQGVKTWPNGDRYEGGFVNDRKQGYGKYVWGRGPWQGDRYAGEYVADKREGFGTYHWASGDVYSGPWKDDQITGPATPMMRAQAKFQEEARKAVAKQGQKVCRRMAVGIALDEWLRGVVVAIGPRKVAIRIDDPGHYGEEVAGVPVKKGDVVWDEPEQWTPCM